MKTSKPKGKTENIPQQKCTLVSQPYFPDLPQDIISEILVRLPVKTLVGFRCVSKSWLNLISNPNFIKTHLQKSSISNNYTTQRLILSHVDRSGSCVNWKSVLNSCSINFSNSNNNVVLVDFPKRDKSRRVSILGSCNGLVCISLSDDAICLWNPCTRKSKEIPLSCMLSWSSIYGFGYDQINNDYKVVWMYASCRVEGYVVGKAKVYSLKKDSWKKINDFPFDATLYDRGIYVNGALHWMSRRENLFDDKSLSMVIVSLDLGNENFGEIAQPCYGETFVSRFILGVLEGRLSIFCYLRALDRKICVDIWTMKEYGVKDSWTKLYTIPYATDMNNYIFTPLCINMTSEIVLKGPMHLYLYNPTDTKFREPKNDELSGDPMEFVAVIYVESLVSPHIDDEVPSPQL